jgi:hypothetical protein
VWLKLNNNKKKFILCQINTVHVVEIKMKFELYIQIKFYGCVLE